MTWAPGALRPMCMVQVAPDICRAPHLDECMVAGVRQRAARLGLGGVGAPGALRLLSWPSRTARCGTSARQANSHLAVHSASRLPPCMPPEHARAVRTDALCDANRTARARSVTTRAQAARHLRTRHGSPHRDGLHASDCITGGGRARCRSCPCSVICRSCLPTVVRGGRPGKQRTRGLAL